MSTLSTTNLKNPSSGSNNIILNADGTIGGAALAGVSDVTGINTTGTVTSGTTSLTVASATGIAAGMYVVGEGITPGTTVSSIASTTVTLSANAGATLSSDPVTFYSPSKIVTPAAVGGMLCRAWVNFNGPGTVAIRASYNVSSITDIGVGLYTVNFTTAMPDANYACVASCSWQAGSRNIISVMSDNNSSETPTASAVKLEVVNYSNGTPFDADYVNVAILR